MCCGCILLLLCFVLYYSIIMLFTVHVFGDCSIDICIIVLFCVFVCSVCVLFFWQVSCPTVWQQNLWTYETIWFVCMYGWITVSPVRPVVKGCDQEPHPLSTGHTGQIVIHTHPQHRYYLSSFWGTMTSSWWQWIAETCSGKIWNVWINHTTTLMHLFVTS
jgi:hypothetical protein